MGYGNFTLKRSPWSFPAGYHYWTLKNVVMMIKDPSFPQIAEFCAKPQNLSFCRGNQPSRGICFSAETVKFLDIHFNTNILFAIFSTSNSPEK